MQGMPEEDPDGQSLGEQCAWLRLVGACGSLCTDLSQPIHTALICAEGNGPPGECPPVDCDNQAAGERGTKDRSRAHRCRQP